MMKKYLINTCIFSLLFSCKTIQSGQTLQGEYEKKGADYSYNLLLKSDSAFYFSKKYTDVNSNCSGRWLFLSRDTLRLICAEAELTTKLQAGYMSDRDKKVIVVNSKTLKIDDVILKRK